MAVDERFSRAWSALCAKWQGDAADAFRQAYVPVLQEQAQRLTACDRQLRETMQKFEDALNQIEATMDD